MRGELDWIVMKALEKDRTRRYETANGLARDIERYLQDEPVEACPPSPATACGSSPASTAAHSAWRPRASSCCWPPAAAVSTWQALLARAAAQAAAAQAGEAEQRKQAEAVLDFVQDRIFAAARPLGRPGGLGQDVTLRQALEAALPDVDRNFADQPLVEARLRMTLASRSCTWATPG